MPSFPLRPRIRCFIRFAGRTTPAQPEGLETFAIERKPDESGFYLRDKVAAPLVFTGEDFAFLWRLENSADRCAALSVLIEVLDDRDGLYKFAYRGSFTLSECTWTPARCRVEVPLVTDDPYRLLLEGWDKEYNLLDATATRVVSRVEFSDLGEGQQFEFARIDKDQEADYVGTEGWALFLRNTSWITGTLFRRGVQDRTLVVFRLVQRGVPYEVLANSSTRPPDLSDKDFFLIDQDDLAQTATYAKTPQITGFKGFTIGTFADWTPAGVVSGFSFSNRKYGDQLLLASCGAAKPSGYIEVTGPEDQHRANNAPDYPACLNVRRDLDDTRAYSVFWRFGLFEFRRGIRLLEAIFYLLQQSAPTLCPSRPELLSDFFTNPTNYVTGATGPDNELPGLLLSAASDIKRPTASEPATRLLVSLKVLLTDLCTLFDCGWFVDPATGFLRIEHRKWHEARALSPLDLTVGDYADKTRGRTGYSYTQQQAPARQTLQAANAVTDALLVTQASYTDATVSYSGQCVNTREGQNSSTTTLQKLTTDLPGLLLNGDQISDSALVLLSPNPAGLIPSANDRLSLTGLVFTYHRYGRTRRTATLDNGTVFTAASLKPTRQQEPLVLCLPGGLAGVSAESRFTTGLSPVGEVAAATWHPVSGEVTLTLLHPAPDDNGLPGSGLGRQFTDSFDQSFA